MASAMDKALLIAMRCGQTSGAREKAWVIDRMIQAFTGDSYTDWVASFQRGEHAPDTYKWGQDIEP